MSRRFVAGIALALVLILGAGCGHSSSSQRSAWVVFASDRDGRWDVYAVHPDGTGLIRVTAGRWDSLPHLAASPDGNWLAIVTGARSIVFDRDGHRHLRPGGDAYAKALVDEKGKVGQVPAEGGSLRSPDGKFEVVVSERGDFRVAPARGGRAHRLARTATGPAWSPDARWLAFSVPAGGPSYDPILDLAVARPDASGFRRVTHSIEGEGAYDVSWSPDGRRLVFARGHSTHVGRFDMDQIWIAGRDGSHMRALTHAYPIGGENDEAVWFDGVLHRVSAPAITRTVGEGQRGELRTHYLVGEGGIRDGRVAGHPVSPYPPTPKPASP